jgi:hypothetical protein
MTPRYDVFISYTKRRDAPAARIIAASLNAAGYSVWFDEQILNRKTSWRMEPNDELISLLKAAIHASRCVVLFAIEQHAIAAPFDVERAEKAHQVIRGAHGLLVSWNWQIFEMGHARETLVIYALRQEAKPDWVIANLVRMNINPSRQNRKRQRGFLKRRWLAIYRRLTRNRRVKALFTALPRPHSCRSCYDRYLQELVFWMSVDLNTISPEGRGHIALVGERGTGKTMLVERFAAFFEKASILGVMLPALEDVDAWIKVALSGPADTILVFDDLGAQLENYPPAAQEIFRRHIGHLLGRRAAILVLSPDHASELLKGVGGSQKVFENRVPVSEIAFTSTVDDIARLVSWQWKDYVDSDHVVFQTERWSPEELVRVLNLCPVYSDLQPVNYRTLDGLQLSEPTKSLKVLTRAIEMAKASASGQVPRVTDEMFDDVIASITGFAIQLLGHGQCDMRSRIVSSVTEGIPLDQNILKQAVEDIYLWRYRTQYRPLAVLCVRDRDKRRVLALRLAEKLLGSEDAVLVLDYEVILDQILDTTVPYTDTFRWMLRSVQRFPWWILVIESLHKAPDIDGLGVKKILEKGEVAFGHCHAVFDRCVLLFDTPACLGSESLGVKVLD